MKTQTFNIALPEELVKKVDQQATKEYKNRSELIRESLRIYLKNRDEWDYLFKIGKEQGKKLGIKSEDDVNRLVHEFRHRKKE